MGKWAPSLYDQLMKVVAKTRVHQARKNLIHKAHGRVLEIGSGTGINFPYYNHNFVTSIDAIEPNTNMIKRSFKRKKHSFIPIEIHQASAEMLPFKDHTFDTVIGTLVFCTIKYPVLAFKEIERVAKPKATILLLEHVKMKQQIIGKAQDIATPLWRKVADGCHLNRDILQTIIASNLTVEEVSEYYKGLVIAVTCTYNPKA